MKRAQIEQLANDLGGKITDMGVLPDNSAYALMGLPLSKDHWLTNNPDSFNVPPMPFKMGTSNPERMKYADALKAAGRYALRCATMNGTVELDPDALIQNLIVGFLGYYTPDGLSTDEWVNPKAT